MIVRYFLIIFLTLFSITLYEADNYIKTKTHYIQKEYEKYERLIRKIKKIDKINKKIEKLDIPVYSKKEAQDIILNKIDSLLTTLPLRVTDFYITDKEIVGKIYLNTQITNIREKEALINIFKTVVPIRIIEFFSLNENHIETKFMFTLPYRDNDGK